jgi:hypothetical protein
MAEEELQLSMGPAYAEAVVACLRGDFGANVDDENFLYNVRERVVEKLDSKLLQLEP